MKNSVRRVSIILLIPFLFIACNQKSKKPDSSAIGELGLKRGEIVSCGSPDKEFGFVDFKISGDEQVQNDFNVAMELLHSFEYDESEKVFAKIIDRSPECAMAYWGVAMCNFHLLWEPPSESDLRKGEKAIAIASSINGKSEKEEAYIEAVAAYYSGWPTTSHPARSVNFEKAMEKLHLKYPEDSEGATIYALALLGASSPADKTYTKQKKAGDLLNALYAITPNHPGTIHYIIHAYDYPSIADLGLPAARRYAEVAPSSAHALHMPSHIFTRLGLWDDCIKSNTESVAAAKCYAESVGIKGHWDEELHGIDYLVYAHLQKAENELAKKQWDYLQSITEVYPVNFKDAYAFAAVPSRYLLENKRWEEAANLEIHPSNFPWNKFQWQKSIFHFTRLIGSVHMADIAQAKSELANLKDIHDSLTKQKDLYKANQVMIQVKAGEAWIALKEGHKQAAILLMEEAADLEDGTEKHPVTPGSIVPARELLGDLLLETNKPDEALAAYESDLKIQPGRFNGLYGAAVACKKLNEKAKAIRYFQQLLALANSSEVSRQELTEARSFLIQNKQQ